MTRLSLARIMYGTNEDFHRAHGTGAAATSAQPVTENSLNPSASLQSGTLGQLLHKVRTALTGKP
jgi:hypothetical protein